jgi:hypothetical protein
VLCPRTGSGGCRELLWVVGLVVVSLPLECGSGWLLLLWVELRWVTWRVWGRWGGLVVSCVLGQAAVAVVSCCPWCVVVVRLVVVPSTQHLTGLLTYQYWATNGNPPLSGPGYHILLRRCRMPSQVLQTNLPPGRITSRGIILSVLSETDTQAAYFYGWQTPVCSLAIGPLNSRPLLRWLY